MKNLQDIMKALIDRENHLKSELVYLKHEKLTKTLNYPKIHLLEERLKELTWVKRKIMN
jgi:hypothetical protein